MIMCRCAEGGVDATTFKLSAAMAQTSGMMEYLKANMQLQEAFIEMVTPSLLQTTTEQKQAFVQSLTAQLKTLLQGDRTSSTSILCDPGRVWLAKQGLWMRLRFIIALLPLLLKKENRVAGAGGTANCKYVDDLVLTLFKFFGKTFLLVPDDDNLFRDLLDLVHALVHNYGEELISAAASGFYNGGIGGRPTSAFGVAAASGTTPDDQEEEVDDSSISSTLRQRLKVRSLILLLPSPS
jgi:uncharacterized protein YsxB (DUF464 family)